MMRSAITISLVPEARGGPFVFWDDLEAGCAKAADLGFDAVEIFPPNPAAVELRRVRPLLERHDLKLAAVGTGGGWVLHKLTLTSADATIRSKAREFVRGMIDAAGQLGAPAILGSMQGRFGEGVNRDAAFGYLIEALNDLGEHAHRQRMPLFFEPLNRYETNLINTLTEGLSLLSSLKTANIRLLADLFHMNIEEPDLSAAIGIAGNAIGHVHFADSNRRPAGNGHTDFTAAARALRDINYCGYLSAECLPWPDSDAAAARTIQSFGTYFR
jgi:sugar phosphate isomerase/epimerase